jgi:Family of unknown function (DUF6788)
MRPVRGLEEGEGTLRMRRGEGTDAKTGGTLRKTPPLPGVLLGETVRCGKPTCRCTTGERHGPYLYRRWREGGRQRRAYVAAAEAERVRAAIAAWRRLHPPAFRARRELAALRRLLRELDEGGW